MGLLTDKILMIPIVLISLTFHEFSHGWVSSKLGDPTPRATGRLTLNPMAHLDPIGALLMIFTGFGWAKPVQINTRYYKKPKWGMALTAAAGPLSNLVLSFIGLLVYIGILCIGIKTQNINELALDITGMFISVNLCFMVFNLIPIPPLDGSRILGLFLPTSAYFKLQRFERYSFIVIVALSFAGVFSAVIGSGVGFFLQWFNEIIESFVNMVI